MAFKQPKVPEYRENESTGSFLRALVLFLKDFCQDAWTANRTQAKALEGVRENLSSLDDMAFLGTNPIGSPADDTVSAWSAMGSGYAWFNKNGLLESQPSQWGFLVSYISGLDVFQIWNTQAGGPTYFRSGNNSGWNKGWRKAYDTSNKPTAGDMGAVSKTGDTMTGALTSTTLGVKHASSMYPVINFYHPNGTHCGFFRCNLPEADRNFSWMQYAADQDEKSSKYGDAYYLPKATAGLTGNKYYPILTAKSAVTIAQGGTGATTAAGARTNLGVRTQAETLLAVYPVGSIYMSVKSTSPASLFGGTWEQLKDRFLLGAGSTYANGATGGARSHSLPLGDSGWAQIVMSGASDYIRQRYITVSKTWDGNRSASFTVSETGFTGMQYGTPLAGTTGSGDTMPPYLAVYIWKRVS